MLVYWLTKVYPVTRFYNSFGSNLIILVGDRNSHCMMLMISTRRQNYERKYDYPLEYLFSVVLDRPRNRAAGVDGLFHRPRNERAQL
jgi:hypothetical protein